MALTLVVELPPDVERHLRNQTPDLESVAKESLAVQLFREGKLSHYQLSQVLGVDRFGTDAVLRRHQVEEQTLTAEAAEEDAARLRDFLDHRRSAS